MTMDWNAIKKRLALDNPDVADIALAVGLAIVACLQIWAFLHFRPEMPQPFVPRSDFEPRPQYPAYLGYIVAACSFLPLAFRRKVPWLAFALSGMSALAYTLAPFPPAFTVLGPMIAIYTLTATAKRRHAGIVALLVGALVLAVAAVTVMQVRWVTEMVGTFALLATAAFLGDTARSRRDYIAEVEQRALDAERTREEEALRRVDEERLRIAREVHDVVAHSLSIIAVQSAAAEALLDADPPRARESVVNIRMTAKQALTELRSVLGVLRTGETEVARRPATDLTQLDHLIEQVRDAGLEVTLDSDLDASRVPALASVSAYRIIQEALTNCVRHARATTAQVSLTVRNDMLHVEVLDNGSGLGEPNGNGHGIRGMRERVEALGGQFETGPLEDAPGFRVLAVLPLTRSA